MTTEVERAVRRYEAQQARRRRRRLLATLLALTVLAGGALVVALAGRGSPKRAAAAPRHPPPRVHYGGSKLEPSPKPKAKRRPGGLPTVEEQRRAVERLVRLGLPILCAGHKRRYIALTFDDGPGPYTDLAMKILRKRHMRATFFLVGRVVELYPSLPAQEAAIGAVADHTWSHPYLPGLTTSEVQKQIVGTREIVERTSHTKVLLFRPPYGAHNRRIDRLVHSLGLLEVLWSVDSGDSLGADVLGVYRNVLRGLKPGAIILMHENRATTIKSLIHHVLPEIQRRHLIPVSVPELLALDPPSYAQVRGRGC